MERLYETGGEKILIKAIYIYTGHRVCIDGKKEVDSDDEIVVDLN